MKAIIHRCLMAACSIYPTPPRPCLVLPVRICQGVCKIPREKAHRLEFNWPLNPHVSFTWGMVMDLEHSGQQVGVSYAYKHIVACMHTSVPHTHGLQCYLVGLGMYGVDEGCMMYDVHDDIS